MWVRSWPTPDVYPTVCHRPHVIDDLYHLEIRDHDYATARDDLARLASSSRLPGLFLVEWDIVLDRDDYILFRDIAMREPSRILVAPYKLWPRSTGKGSAIWAHSDNGKFIDPSITWCDQFSFGCIYIPWFDIFEFLERPPKPDGRMTDTNFSTWYKTRRFLSARLTWQVRPIHLHWGIPR